MSEIDELLRELVTQGRLSPNQARDIKSGTEPIDTALREALAEISRLQKVEHAAFRFALDEKPSLPALCQALELPSIDD